MEEAAERWRAEKRRLNAEIDKLEGALADAKNTAGKKRNGTNGSKPKPPDPLAYASSQDAAEEKLIRAKLEWDSERAKLLSEINRLEGAVADAIARASNPLRVTQSVKEQFETELNRVAKEKTEIEQAFLRSKTQWEQEKLKMTGEMVKLRRAAQIMNKRHRELAKLKAIGSVRNALSHFVPGGSQRMREVTRRSHLRRFR